MHFDHERIPERVVHARGAGAHGRFQLYDSLEDITCAAVLTDTSRRDPGVRAVLDRRRLPGVDGHRPGRAGLRGEVLHRRGQLGSGRQQHPRLLHPGRHQVPRLHPRREARARPRDPAGPDGPRHVLGLRVAAAREHPHADVGHVRPGHPPLLPDDGGLRRPHLPARERGRGDVAGEVPLEAGGRHPLASSGRSPRSSAASTPTSTGATSGTPSRPARSPSGTSACR